MSTLPRKLVRSAFLFPVVIFGIGCQDLSLPEFLLLYFPDGTSYNAPRGSGAPSLAGTTWAVYQVGGDQNTPELRFELGSDGELKRVFDNQAFAVDVIGETFIPDGARHATSFPSSSYLGESYVGEQGSFVVASGYGKFFIGPLLAASSTATVSGTVNDARNRMDGTFTVELIDINPAFAGVIEGLFGQEPPSLEWEVYALLES